MNDTYLLNMLDAIKAEPDAEPATVAEFVTSITSAPVTPTDNEPAFLAPVGVDVEAEQEQPFEDIGGVRHQRQPFGTMPQRGDVVQSDDKDRDWVWRPVTVRQSRFEKSREAERKAEQARAEIEARPDATDVELVQAKVNLELATRKRKAEQDSPEESRLRDRIDEWRAGAGRSKYNASRRKVRTESNAQIASLSANERAERRRAQTRARVAKCRAAKKAAKSATQG